MANNVSTAAQNFAADAVVSAAMSVFLHDSAVPNGDGANNRILATGKALAANRFGAAAAGTVDTANAENFGVLDAGSSSTVMAYSVFRGSTFLWDADMTSDVVVAAGEQFEMDAGGIGFTVT